jgi:nicotinamidase/pyrazinamidase
MITLIIVDCQNDFITGTLTVKGAKNSVEEIKKFIKSHYKEIEKIIFTVDWHPYNHSSFKKYGGQWPHHCVQYTPGACIEPKLLKYVQSFEIDYEVSTKGEIEEVEQYGAFSEIEYVEDSDLSSRYYYFDSLVTANADTTFVVCGIAGDYCVKETIQNMINEGITPKVFCPGIVSIDGGKTFSDFVKENKLEKIV